MPKKHNDMDIKGRDKNSILIGVTASIASYKACDIVRSFIKKGYSVRCVMTSDAKWFITQLTLETLSGKKVISDMFALPEGRRPEHIALADEADLVLIAPATADIIGKIASGICDDILACTVSACDKPVVFAPAMNDKMFNNPITQDKIKYLRSKGYYFVPPIKGPLACGSEGVGCLAPIETIVETVEKILKNN